ncbi:PTS system, mannose/fructose/sorbose family, IIA component [Enterococcus raffinosus ATCC 49464]|uniref:PTS system, mannose/fructose/sorbose family, IIA component n=1 Tax=Enterococcus raffinosus ATCC 49464 TaxID=1158602 RepID=R2RG86_9ENTE|nr:PTS sugar transporter subunit IIA [Enterococcus raffinosus]EOH74984.1 PTS system, mannose/fructose/sorbose family, IIA component [Enterococcus raffinosus ATCC 49464]EOT82163.1 hypothetical protein I590_00588 [Enterococcus raffinosus ATCC 49464]
MFPIVIATHGNLGKELIETSKLIMGEQEKLFSHCLHQGDDYTLWRQELQAILKKLNKDKGVLVLTDLFGGSPSNSVARFLEDPSIECVTGVNLPILLEALNTREQTNNLEEVKQQCIDSGKNSIFDLFLFLDQRITESKK